MSTKNFNMRLDTDTKKQLDNVLASYGLTTPQVFKLLANQIVKTRKVPLSFDWVEPNMETQKAMREALNRTEFTESYTPDELLRTLEEPNDAKDSYREQV